MILGTFIHPTKVCATCKKLTTRDYSYEPNKQDLYPWWAYLPLEKKNSGVNSNYTYYRMYNASLNYYIYLTI